MDNSFWLLNLRMLFFDLVVAFCLAKLEIQIEGKNGWAANLPTWRIKNRFTKLIWGEQPYTGYHFWIFNTFFLMLHIPFVIDPGSWSLSKELIIIAHSQLGILVEDFLWFALNPAYGLKKFNPAHAPWHISWFLRLPVLYYKLTGIIIIFSGIAFILK